MHTDHKSNGSEIGRGLLWAHAILLLHILLVAFLALVVLLLGGLARHLIWVFIGGSLLLLCAAYGLYRRFKKNKADFYHTLDNVSQPRDRDIEIRILGGLLSINVNRRGGSGSVLPDARKREAPQLEGPDTLRNRELLELAALLERNLITPNEFERAKKNILDPK
jgi:hypothetical protein